MRTRMPIRISRRRTHEKKGMRKEEKIFSLYASAVVFPVAAARGGMTSLPFVKLQSPAKK